MPPMPLVTTTAWTMALADGSHVTSHAVARMQNSSSSGPGSAWITHRGSLRMSHPFGDDCGIAPKSRACEDRAEGMQTQAAVIGCFWATLRLSFGRNFV